MVLRHRVVVCCRPVDPLVDRIHGFLGVSVRSEISVPPFR